MTKSGIPITPEAAVVANRRAPLPPLPPIQCGGCRACCRGEAVPLTPRDNPARYKTKGGALAQDKHGDCVYLGKRGCQIQATKPELCRAYDCRAHAWGVLHLPPKFQEGRIDRPAVQAGLRHLRALGII